MGKSRLDRIVDMHCHILPGVDDGSRSMVETLKMLKIASSEGITEMIVTPHYKEGHKNASPEEIETAIQNVTQTAQTLHLNISLYPGNEIYYFQGVEELLEEGKVCSMNNSGYVLVEFSPMETYPVIRNAMDSLASYGYTPILAHVERYDCLLNNMHNVERLKRMNVRIQVNASAVVGDDGYKVKQFTSKLLKSQIVDYVSTDAHRSEERTPSIQRCAAMLRRRYDADYVDKILWKNAAGLID